MRTKTLEQNTAQDFAGLQVDQLQKLRNGNITFEQIKWFNNLTFERREALMGKHPEKGEILKLISGVHEIVIEMCDGTQTILAAKEIFRSGIDGDLKSWDTNKSSTPTKATLLEIHEMLRDSTLAQVFNSLGGDLNKLHLTQHQIALFCEVQREWLRKDGFATFFLLKVEDHFFVVCARVYFNGLRAFVHRFDDNRVWPAHTHPRVVIPQFS